MLKVFNVTRLWKIHNRNVPSVTKSSVKSNIMYNGCCFLSITLQYVFNEGYNSCLTFWIACYLTYIIGMFQSVIKSSAKSNKIYNKCYFLSIMLQHVFNEGYGLTGFLNSLLPVIHNRNVPNIIKSSVESDMIYNGCCFLSIILQHVFNEGYGLLIDFLNSLLPDIHRDSSRMLQ